MSNVEHLFENALVALENDYYFGEWKRIEKDRHNTDGVSEEVLEAIWELAIYTKYTYEPSLKAIPIEWIKKQKVVFQNEDYPFNYTRGVQDGYNDCIDYLIDEWVEEQASLFEKQITEECTSAERFADWEEENGTRNTDS